MPSAAILSVGTTPGGFLLVLAIALPVAGALIALLLGGRYAERVAIVVMPFGLAVASAIACRRVAVAEGVAIRHRRLETTARGGVARRWAIGGDGADRGDY